MSYPLLRIAKAYAHVEVRRGRGAAGWKNLEPVFSGPAKAKQEWRGEEGEKLSARHCLWPTDPGSTMSQPYTVSSIDGLDAGKPETLVFPSGISGFAALWGGDRPILHEYAASGNCYKIRLTAALLGLPIKRREYDIMKGETRTPDFLANVNANGRIPVLQVGDRFLPESNAACFWLADGSHLVPQDRFERADMLHWMFFEQYNHEPNVATLRFWMQWIGEANLNDAQRAQMPAKQAAGAAALKLMDDHLAAQDWLVGDTLSLADIVLYAYTHVAEDGGLFALADYPAVQAWIARVEAEPGYVAIGA